MFLACLYSPSSSAQFLSLPADEPRIETLLFHPTGQPLSPPVVPLSQELGLLEIRFDDLSGDYTPWEITIVHCDRHWTPSDMHPSEYLQGFYTTPMEDDEASFGTKVDFTHHSVRLPNDDLSWTLSGNYLLQVLDPDAPETPVAVRRFVVFEDLCRVEAQAGEPSDIALRRSHQEVHFSVFEEGYNLSDPYDRLEATVVPNWRWDRAISGKDPRFVKGNEIDYRRTGHIFEGGNTYRFADLKGLEFLALGVASLQESDDHWHFYLDTDVRRTYDTFAGGDDIHGAMVTHNDRLEPYTGSDYVWVHWSLDTRHPLVGRDIYIVGAFTQNQCLPHFRMQYNAGRGVYTLQHKLKQGYYNYHYVVKDPKDAAGEPGTLFDLEGSHNRTDNLYSLFVHYADWDGYDRVVGFAQWESNP